ncbi:MAG: septal ring lytic transglycosylase RlpA family protein, partial [Candidatus Caenarcaniphilales bacterium]|nr:septal ring lytic transglycosylase RlpA family protein [Candidatus Caenarcaniphilales bacterium]
MNLIPIQKYLKSFKSPLLQFFVISLLILSPALQALSQGTFPSEGKASWIGERFQGKKTSSGELFDMNDLTASHATLPYGSKLKITSKKTGKSVVVRVNNRSEIDNGRVIDLSKRAAEQIGLIEEGVGIVKVELVSQAATPKITENKNSTLNTQTSPQATASATAVSGKYVIQYASFFDLDNAVEFRDELKKKNIDSTIEAGKGSDGKSVYRVNSITQYNSRVEAKNALATIAPQQGIIIPATQSEASP